jgi:integrase
MKNEIITTQNNFDLIGAANKIHGISDNSRYTYKTQMSAYMKYCELNNLKPDIDSLIKWIKQTENMETAQVRLASIKKILGQVYRHDPRLAELKEILSDIKPGKRNRAITETNYLTEKEKKLLVKNCPEKIGLIIEVLFWTGLRISAALNIELEKCLSVENVIEIRVLEKGKKENIVFLQKKHFDRCREVFQGKKYLFEHEGLRYDRKYITKKISVYGRKFLDKQISAHSLRHSKAMYLKDIMHLSVDQVQKALNHSKPTTTIEHYFHGKPDAKKQGIK